MINELMDASAESEEIVRKVKERALLFCVDNPKVAHLVTEIETAMFVGAAIVHEVQAGNDEL